MIWLASFVDHSAVLLVGHLCLVVSCDSHAFASVKCCLVITCWERADVFALVGDFIVLLLLSYVVSWFRCDT